MALGGSRPLTPWAAALGFPRLYNTEIQLKCHNNLKKKRKEGEEEKGVREEVVKVRSSAGFWSRWR
jgi:hypothetical protein